MFADSDLHEKGEPLIFLLLTLDELQRRRHVAAESSYCALYLLLFLTTKLEEAANICATTNCKFQVSHTFDTAYRAQDLFKERLLINGVIAILESSG